MSGDLWPKGDLGWLGSSKLESQANECTSLVGGGLFISHLLLFYFHPKMQLEKCCHDGLG